jgi:hypothetical protein
LGAVQHAISQQLHLIRVLDLALDLPRLRLALRAACCWLSPLRFASSVMVLLMERFTLSLAGAPSRTVLRRPMANLPSSSAASFALHQRVANNVRIESKNESFEQTLGGLGHFRKDVADDLPAPGPIKAYVPSCPAASSATAAPKERLQVFSNCFSRHSRGARLAASLKRGLGQNRRLPLPIRRGSWAS